MSTTATRILAETIRSVGFGAIGIGYSNVGFPLAFPSVLMTFTNATDEGVIFSFDGVHDHVFINDGITGTFNFSSNKVNDRGLFLAQGTVIYVRAAAATPTSGSVYISSFYAYPGTGS